MILKASQRGGGRQLALHLLKTADNEHVEVHELRGFMARDLPSAFQEAHAVSKGTRAKQFLFSLSLNPPSHARVSVAEFEKAIDAVEQKLGLEGQPRAVVFHEKDGRRHAHVVWSRIDASAMKAINLSHYKLKLRDVSRALYLEHQWQMPRGLVNSRERDPKNYSRAEYEQAKRAKQDPKALKAMFQECWASSDSGKAFAHALKARGYELARGDRRGYVAVDFRGEVYAVAKWVGVKTAEVRKRLGDANKLPSLEQAKTAIASRMTDAIRDHVRDAEKDFQKKAATLAFHRTQIVERQRKERAELEAAHAKRWAAESKQRAAKLSRGFKGLWDWVTGKHHKLIKQNEREALDAMRRDRAEKDKLIERHIDEREMFHRVVKETRQKHAKEVAALHRDIASYNQMRAEGRAPDASEHFQEATRRQAESRKAPTRDLGPKHEI